MDIKGETDSSTIIVGDFNTPFTSMDKSSKEKINKETLVLNDILKQMDFQKQQNIHYFQVHIEHFPV